MNAIQTQPTLEQLTRADLIRRVLESDLAYSFKHALVQDTAYASLLKNERKFLHRLVARSIQDNAPQLLDENAARLAEHYFLAEEWERAAEFAVRAGAQALHFFAAREALAHYERALNALERLGSPAPTVLYDALVGWADAAAQFRPYPEKLERLARAEEIARALNDKSRLAQALYRIGSVHIAQGHNLRAIPPLAECFTLLQELDERLAVMPTYFMGWASFDSDPRDALGFFERAIELAQRYENTDAEALSWSMKAWTGARLGEFANARDAVARAQQLLPRVQSPMAASDVDLFAGWAYLEMNDATRGLEFGQRGLAKAQAADNIDCVCGAYLCVGFNQLRMRQPAQATDAFQNAIRQSRFSGAEALEIMGQMGLALAKFYNGQGDSIHELEQTYTRAEAMQDEMGMAGVAQALGEMYLQRGDAARAEAWLNKALQLLQRDQLIPSLAQTLEDLAQVYELQGRADDAAQTRAQAEKWQQRLARENANA